MCSSFPALKLQACFLIFMKIQRVLKLQNLRSFIVVKVFLQNHVAKHGQVLLVQCSNQLINRYLFSQQRLKLVQQQLLGTLRVLLRQQVAERLSSIATLEDHTWRACLRLMMQMMASQMYSLTVQRLTQLFITQMPALTLLELVLQQIDFHSDLAVNV